MWCKTLKGVDITNCKSSLTAQSHWKEQDQRLLHTLSRLKIHIIELFIIQFAMIKGRFMVCTEIRVLQLFIYLPLLFYIYGRHTHCSVPTVIDIENITMYIQTKVYPRPFMIIFEILILIRTIHYSNNLSTCQNQIVTVRYKKL